MTDDSKKKTPEARESVRLWSELAERVLRRRVPSSSPAAGDKKEDEQDA